MQRNISATVFKLIAALALRLERLSTQYRKTKTKPIRLLSKSKNRSKTKSKVIAFHLITFHTQLETALDQFFCKYLFITCG